MGSCGWFPLSHAEILAWVERHSDELPHTLDDLARFPIPFRKVIVNRVGPETRLSLWDEHIASFLTDESLSADQRAFVAETLTLLPAIFASSAPNPTIVEWEQRAKNIFSRQQAMQMFGTLGPQEPPEGLPLPPDAPVGAGAPGS
jgi:hypothetical protein